MRRPCRLAAPDAAGLRVQTTASLARQDHWDVNTEASTSPGRGSAATERLGPDEAGIARAAALLAEGGLVAFPTETVYGLGADARDPQAVARLYAAKERPHFNPL